MTGLGYGKPICCGATCCGEELQTTQAFEYARDLMVQAMRNEAMLLLVVMVLLKLKTQLLLLMLLLL